MPLFDYRCRECQFRFEELIRNKTEEASVVCPTCRSAEVERTLAAFAVGSGSKGATRSSSSCASPRGFT